RLSSDLQCDHKIRAVQKSDLDNYWLRKDSQLHIFPFDQQRRKVNPMYDLILKGGRIYDGSGMPSFIGDVATSDGRIEEIGRINASADRVLDVGGLAVAPGIIDFHTHFDAQLWWDPLASSSHEHGVTTVVMGNCGLTLAPCKPASRDALIGTFVRVEDMPRASLQAGIPWEWTTHGEFLDALERKPLGVDGGARRVHRARAR